MMSDETCKMACGYFVSVSELIDELKRLNYTHVSCDYLNDIINGLAEEVEICVDGTDSLYHLGQEDEDPQGLFGGSNIIIFSNRDGDTKDAGDENDSDGVKR